MDASASQTLNLGHNPFGIVEFEDFLMTFGTPWSGKVSAATAAGSSSASNSCFVSSTHTLKAQWSSEKSNCLFMTGGDYEEKYSMGSTEQPRMQCFSDRPRISNFVSPCGELIFGPMNLPKFDNARFREIVNGTLYSGNEDETMNNDLRTCRLRRNQEISETPAGARPLIDLNWAQEILKDGDYWLKEVLISMLQGSICTLMIDKKKYRLFQTLIGVSEDKLLKSLVEEILSQNQFFINAAFCQQGAKSIVTLIKKLKNSHYAFSVTKILSTRFLDIMTHHIASTVIQGCLIFFESEPNEILYEKTICHFQDLATHEVGCRSLNNCIDTIAGEQRSKLLNHIADVSDYLSNDPYGNHVVQQVLMQKDINVTSRILCCLQSQFIQLAKTKGGSQVVEKCMKSSNLGIHFVVQKILNSPQVPFLLAGDRFGNYVIRTALEKTKKLGFSILYYSLVESLQPYRRRLNLTTGGKRVIDLIKADMR